MLCCKQESTRHAYGNEASSIYRQLIGRNVNNLRYTDDTTLMAESEELKSILMKVKEDSHCFLIHYLLIGFFNPDASVLAPQRYCLGSYYFSLPAGSRWGPCILGLDLFTFLIISIVLSETGGLDLNPDHDSS